jgi:hypothetical protein
MKSMKKVLLFTAVICLIVSCSKSDSFSADDDMNVSLKKAKAEPTMVTVPFKADFVGTYLEGTGPYAECGPWDPENGVFWGIVFNEGGGTGTHLGKFTHHFEFCCEFVSGIYPGPTGYMEAYLTAANGDILYVECAGQVINGRLDYHPDDVNSYFKDPFVILGGTGKFEGATGSGYTDDYNRDAYPDNSFHHWTGTITMVKGKH